MKRRLLFVMAVALVCTSCGKRIYPVSGKVTYKDEPAVGAAVFFHRQGGDSMNDHLIMGIVQDDGSFTLDCGALGKGAPPGAYDVLIDWPQHSNQAKGLAHKPADRLKGRYADQNHPLLHAEIRAGTAAASTGRTSL